MQDLMALAHLESEERKKKWTGTTGGHAAPVEQPCMWVSSSEVTHSESSSAPDVPLPTPTSMEPWTRLGALCTCIVCVLSCEVRPS